MVFYRKYRPQIIDELDSTSVRETLTQVLKSSLPHALLFTGPKGLGKTSTARIVAKVVNCTGRGERGKVFDSEAQTQGGKGEKEQKESLNASPFTLNPSIEPCNICEQCISITSGTNMDVLEIDAASNRGIDEMRELKDKIRLAPLSATKKVYIIDEVHMLTTEAFNALLKTLEEPPSHAIFILCTTEVHKVPPTILSRCFHLQFKPATKEELTRSFRRIVAGEKLTIDDEALSSIAELSDSGFRDGSKILEELVALSPKDPITKELIEKHYRISGMTHMVSQLIGLLAAKDMKSSMQLISQLMKEEVNIVYFTEQLTHELHAILLGKIGIAGPIHSQNTQVTLSIHEIKLLLQLLTKAAGEMKSAVIPELPLELAVIEWHEDYKNTHSDQITHRDEKSKDEELKKVYKSDDSVVSVTTLRKQVGNMQKIKALYGEDPLTETVQESPVVSITSGELLNYRSDGDLTPEWIDTFWKCIISEMKKHNHTIAGVLRGCIIRSFDRENLIIETSYKFHKAKLDDTKTKEALQAVCKELIGKPISVEIVLKSN